MVTICLCGCGKNAVKGAAWAHGHLPKPVLKKCKCGCGKLVKSEWAQGHYARLNNPSKLDEVKMKRSVSAKRRIDSGERTFAGWNKNLSKESDERVAKYGDSNSKLLQASPERLEKRSQSCRLQWKENRIRTNKGSQCYQWKGGVSSLQQWCRAALYQKWSKPIMIRDKFTCQMCKLNIGGNLCVHHDEEKFATILHKVVAGRQVPEILVDEKMQIINDIVSYHIDNNIHGITLCRECHNKIHETEKDSD